MSAWWVCMYVYFFRLWHWHKRAYVRICHPLSFDGFLVYDQNLIFTLPLPPSQTFYVCACACVYVNCVCFLWTSLDPFKLGGCAVHYCSERESPHFFLAHSLHYPRVLSRWLFHLLLYFLHSPTCPCSSFFEQQQQQQDKTWSRWRWRRNICDIKRVNTHYMRTQHTIRYVYVLLCNTCVVRLSSHCTLLLFSFSFHCFCCCRWRCCYFSFFIFLSLHRKHLLFVRARARLLARPRFPVVQFNLCIYLLCIKTDPCTHNRAAARELQMIVYTRRTDEWNKREGEWQRQARMRASRVYVAPAHRVSTGMNEKANAKKERVSSCVRADVRVRAHAHT